MMKRLLTISIGLAFLISFSVSCDKEAAFSESPYAGGKEIIEVSFADALPSPSQGLPGAKMTFRVSGLMTYKDQVEFLINGIQAQIAEITDSTLTAVIPQGASTGGVRAIVGGQVFPGPICRIIGKLALDPTFRSGTGTNGPIFDILQTSSNQLYLAGTFSDYNGRSVGGTIRGLARITPSGDFVQGMNYGDGVGLNAAILSISEINSGNLLIAGRFNQYDTIRHVSNITTISANGQLNVTSHNILNLTEDPAKSYLNAPIFNGGVNNTIANAYVHNNKVTVVGNFQSYVNRFYLRSTYDNILTDFFGMNGVLRMNMDGSLDSTYMVNKNTIPATGYRGFNGTIFASHLNQEGKLLIGGRFTSYTGQNNLPRAAGNLIRFNEDGSIDNSFNIGTGADEAITYITKSTFSEHYLLAGYFKSINGKSAPGIAILDHNGNLVDEFQSKGFEGGLPSFIYQLSNGLIVVTGTFTKYGDTIREGLLVLNPDGTLADDYNNTGRLYGMVNDAIEGTNSLQQRTLTLVGYIDRFNGQSNLGNIMRLVFQD